ncbi:MAG: hypothetical protein ACFHWZ_04670 [Phycisphaerales bacterium]
MPASTPRIWRGLERDAEHFVEVARSDEQGAEPEEHVQFGVATAQRDLTITEFDHGQREQARGLGDLFDAIWIGRLIRERGDEQAAHRSFGNAEREDDAPVGQSDGFAGGAGFDGLGDWAVGLGRVIDAPGRSFCRLGRDLPAVAIAEGDLDAEERGQPGAECREGTVGQKVVDRDRLTRRDRRFGEHGRIGPGLTVGTTWGGAGHGPFMIVCGARSRQHDGSGLLLGLWLWIPG